GSGGRPDGAGRRGFGSGRSRGRAQLSHGGSHHPRTVRGRGLTGDQPPYSSRSTERVVSQTVVPRNPRPNAAAGGTRGSFTATPARARDDARGTMRSLLTL